MIDDFIGKWKLETNDENFKNFLYYYGYNWIKANAALVSNVDVTIIKKNTNPIIISRLIDSSFLTTHEDYIFDNEFNTNSYNLQKKHQYINNQILSDIKGSSICNTRLVEWKEISYIHNNNLIITRKWINEDNQRIESTQVYSKLN